MSTTNATDYVDSTGQVGTKTWRLVPGDGIKIVKGTNSGTDTYTVSSNVSDEEDNALQIADDGLYVPAVTSKVQELKDAIEDLRTKVQNLKDTEYRSTSSVTFDKTENADTSDTITATVNISMDEDNAIQLKSDGLFAQSMDSDPGSIQGIEKRLNVLENNLKVLSQYIDNIKTSATIDEDGTVTPDPVVPDGLL
jgi:archaellum component FlaC